MLSDKDIKRIEHLAEINAKLNNPGWKEMFALLADREAVIAKIEKLKKLSWKTYEAGGKEDGTFWHGYFKACCIILNFIRNPQGG